MRFALIVPAIVLLACGEDIAARIDRILDPR